MQIQGILHKHTTKEFSWNSLVLRPWNNFRLLKINAQIVHFWVDQSKINDPYVCRQYPSHIFHGFFEMKNWMMSDMYQTWISSFWPLIKTSFSHQNIILFKHFLKEIWGNLKRKIAKFCFKSTILTLQRYQPHFHSNHSGAHCLFEQCAKHMINSQFLIKWSRQCFDHVLR